MKVSLITYRLSGGAFSLGFAALAKGLVANGVKDIDLVFLGEIGAGEIDTFPSEVRFHKLSAARSRYAPFAIARYFREEKPDLAISMPIHMNVPCILGWRFAHHLQSKLIVSERATLSHKVYVQNRGSLVWRTFPPLVRMVYPLASGLVCNSDEVASDLVNRIGLRMPSSRMSIIPPAIDVGSVVGQQEMRADHPWLTDRRGPILVNVARLSVEKNHSLLFKAFAFLRRKHDCRLLILGEGPLRTEIEQEIRQLGLENYVDLLGYVHNPASYVARADVFVLTSIEEAFGRVLVEAMACGTPVVATDAIGGGPRSILEGGRYGILVGSGDVVELRNALDLVLSDVAIAQQMSVAGKERARMCEPRKIAQEWLEFSATL